MEKKLFKDIVYGLRKKQLDSYSVKDINFVNKTIAKIKKDIKTLGLEVNEEHFLLDINNVLLGNDIQISKNIKNIGHKTSIDQRGRKLRELSSLRWKYEYGDKKVKNLEKEIQTSIKKQNLFQDSSSFLNMVDLISKNNNNKKNSYIKIQTSCSVECVDCYDNGETSYLLDVAILTPQELKIQKEKIDNQYRFIEKYNNQYYLVRLRETEEIPKDFDLLLIQNIKIDIDKLLDKSLVKLKTL